MKYSSRYPVTSAHMDGDYRITVDGILAFHENTIASYLTTLGLAAFDLQKEGKTWVISEIDLELPAPMTIWSEEVEISVWVSEVSAARIWFDFTMKEMHTGKVTAKGHTGNVSY